MIYLNQAGTTWPKPEAVNEAMLRFNQLSPSDWLEVFHEGTEVVTRFFGIKNPNRFLFTQSCTQSLAVAFSDFPWEQGDRLIISSMEHHALSRWHHKLKHERGVDGVIIPRGEEGPLDLDALEKELKVGARMVAMTMASNVTGEVLPYLEIIRLCKHYGAVCLLDGAQTAGVIPINMTELDPDIFVFAGHKGPFGPQGIGGLYISERVSMTCPSAACEVISGQKRMAAFPTYCDTGSAPMLTMTGLTAGIKWLEDKGWAKLTNYREILANKLRGGLSKIGAIEIIGSATWGKYTGAVSIICHSHSLDEVKDYLWEAGSIKGSLGFQCAPLSHEAVGTSETGTLRFSVGTMNTEEEVDFLLDTLTNFFS